MGYELDNDYVFRYRLEPDGESSTTNPAEVVKSQLQNLLDIVILTEGNREVKIDGFRFIKDTTIHRLFNGTKPLVAHQGRLESDVVYEPRIDFIRRQLDSILSIVDLEINKSVVKPDGFRLKNLSSWCVNSTGDPNDIIDYLGTRCSYECLWCCNKVNPPGIALTRRRMTPEEEYQELKTRVRYFSPGSGTSLFPSPGIVYESLVHPFCLEILRLLREKSLLPFRIQTNGETLTDNFVTSLAELKPIYLYLSLNSSSLKRRKELMRDSAPEIAINALPLLKAAGIPYAVTIVPWPTGSTDEMLDDLALTVGYADSQMAHLIQVNLPGFSKYLRPPSLFSLPEIWPAIVAKVRELREKTDCPIVVMPSMFEENNYEKRLGLARIVGVVKNSPALIAGLVKGDLILEINGIRINSRSQAWTLLSMIQKGDISQIDMKVQRGQNILDIPISLHEYSYPYTKDTDTHLGIVFLGTGLANYVEQLMEIVSRHKAKDVLFLSSYLVKPAFEQQLAEYVKLGDVRIDIEIPENRFFGGNICMGDLLVAQDFIDCIKAYLEKVKREPDLIVIPSTPFALGGWGRDLTGRTYLNIEREVGIAVELLNCKPIYE